VATELSEFVHQLLRASRNLFDLSVGHDNIFHGDRYKWSVRLAIVNHREQGSLV
jgi:hypothetical protein